MEHFIYPNEVHGILRAIRRVLAPGGAIKLVVPDAGRALTAYGTNEHEFFAARRVRSYLAKERPTSMHIVNYIFRQDGQHKYRLYRCRDAGAGAGAGRIRRRPPAPLRSGDRFGAPARRQQSLHGSGNAFREITGLTAPCIHAVRGSCTSGSWGP